MSDWRWDNLVDEPQLRGVQLRRMPYRQYRPGWDHDHCIACYAKLVEDSSPVEGAEHVGCATTDEYVRGAEYDWVCLRCFADCKDALSWKEV